MGGHEISNIGQHEVIRLVATLIEDIELLTVIDNSHGLSLPLGHATRCQHFLIWSAA